MMTDVQFALRQIRTSLGENIKTSDETGSNPGSGHSCLGFVGPLESSSYNKNFWLCLSTQWVASSAMWPCLCMVLECCWSLCATFNWLLFQKQDAKPLRIGGCLWIAVKWRMLPAAFFSSPPLWRKKSMLRLQRDIGKTAKLRTKRRDRDGVAGVEGSKCGLT